MRRLAGKRVLITGGARGIGRALAIRLAAEGCELILTDVEPNLLPEAAAAVVAAGGQAATYKLDVTDLDAITQLRERLLREQGPIDLLINNAGVVFGGGFLEVPLEQHFRTYQINLLGLVAVTRAFLPDLIGRPEGHLVNIASAAGFIGLPQGATYASSKWAVVGFSDSIRQELAAEGYGHVHVSIICPSYVSTGLFDGARAPRLTRILTAERVAELTVRTIKKNRSYMLTPWLVKMTPALKGLLPTPLFELTSKLFGATSGMTAWHGRDGIMGRSNER
jgi:all-trans-retinol dehydrogenase (NAD+)